jgi:hypothetical protein
MQKSPSWQSTVIALAFIALVGALFLVVYLHDDIDVALKAWAGIGTLVGIVVGAIPTYFFGQSATASAREDANASRQRADWEVTQRERAEQRAQVMAGLADPTVTDRARQMRPDLFGPEALAPAPRTERV